MSRFEKVVGGVALLLMLCSPAVSHAGDIDLSTWTAEVP
jgi:hypothetical protein